MYNNLSSKTVTISFLIIASVWISLVFTYRYFVNQEINKSPLLSSLPLTTKPVSLILNVSNPQNNILVYTADLLVQGKTITDATVILSLNSEDKVVPVNSKGEFSETIKLEEGLNILKIAAFDALGNTKNESRTIYYATEKI